MKPSCSSASWSLSCLFCANARAAATCHRYRIHYQLQPPATDTGFIPQSTAVPYHSPVDCCTLSLHSRLLYLITPQTTAVPHHSTVDCCTSSLHSRLLYLITPQSTAVPHHSTDDCCTSSLHSRLLYLITPQSTAVPCHSEALPSGSRCRPPQSGVCPARAPVAPLDCVVPQTDDSATGCLAPVSRRQHMV